MFLIGDGHVLEICDLTIGLISITYLLRRFLIYLRIINILETRT